MSCRSHVKIKNPTAFGASVDGAPLLFGTDIRLRNLLALAKYGPLYTRDLVRITGSGKTRESASNAPFGRGGVVRTWQGENGQAVDLDPAHPVARHLRRLLLALEKRFPIHCDSLPMSPPVSPLLHRWQGDRLALFGSPIPTHILFTIGVLGWTFEGLCVSAASGYDRVSVKNALKKLEDEGILVGERDRRPGFNVRKVTISDTCPGGLELAALLVACVEVWPDLKRSVDLAMNQLSPRTKEHLRRRGLLDRKIIPKSNSSRSTQQTRDLSESERKDRALLSYRAICAELGFVVRSTDLISTRSIIYTEILALWGGFKNFCAANGIVPEYHKARQSKEAVVQQEIEVLNKAEDTATAAVSDVEEKRRICIARYRALTEKHGRELTSGELHHGGDSNLYRLILTCWDTFPDFRVAAGLPRKRTAEARLPSPMLRDQCIAEYSAMSARLGRSPNSMDLRNEDVTLLDRITLQWGTFPEFCEEMRISLKRRHRDLRKVDDAVLRERCRDQYRLATLRLGYPPTSRKLQDVTDGLFSRIKTLWGSFEAFCDDLGVEPAGMRRKKVGRRKE